MQHPSFLFSALAIVCQNVPMFRRKVPSFIQTSMADDSDDETFVIIGRPLPGYEDDEVTKKAIPYQEQSVQDARGKPQRLHGAFTGGFSAGYFNTVGSKEGWQPATFRSSRADRGDRQQQKPEDFMDEEDLGDHGIAPRQVSTTQNFTSEGKQRDSRKRHLPGGSVGIIPQDDLIRDIIVPTSVPVGVQLLRKMGWKEGQGVGPKVKKKPKKQPLSAPKVYGCALPAEDVSEESEDEFAARFTFAPKDTNPINFDAKDNRHGLGYSGINARSVLGSTSLSLFNEPPAVSKTGQRGIKGHAFGISVLEDDDEDIYSTDSKSNYMKELGGPEQDEFHGWTAPRHTDSSKMAIGYVRAVLEGFELSSQSLKTQKVYPPPDLPRNFRPIHQPILAQDGPHSIPIPTKPPERRKMDASVRATLIGEAPEIGSVFDLVSKEDKDKISAAKQMPQHSAAQSEKIIPVIQDQSMQGSEKLPVKELAKAIEVVRTQGVPLFGGVPSFKPFARNPEKQTRYEMYLETTKHGMKGGSDDIPPGNLTEWERNCEREEFVRAAQLYRPMSSLMAARFTQAKYDDDTENTEVAAEGQGDLNDQQKAAHMKMFGKLTRDHFEWHPDKLLCKRFNIPNPYPESSLVGVPKVKRDKFSLFNFLTIPADPDRPASPPKQPTDRPKAIEYKEESLNSTEPVRLFADVDKMQSKPLTGGETSTDSVDRETTTALPEAMKNAPTKDQEEDSRDADDEQRPPMDLFQAIFAVSDSDKSSSDSEPEEDEKQQKSNVHSPKIAMETSHSNVTDHEDISTDLDKGGTESHSNRIEEEIDSVEVESLERRLHPDVSTAGDDQYYGPVLPPTVQTKDYTLQTHVLHSSAEKTDSHRKKKHRHKERKDKHKDKKKKSKHKKKKHHKESKKLKKHKHRHKSSSDSRSGSDGSASSNSDSDLPSNVVLLQRLKSLPTK